MDKLFCICRGEHWTKSCDIPKMEEGTDAQMFNMSLKSQIRVHSNTKVDK